MDVGVSGDWGFWLTIVGIVALLVMSALLSGSETAITAASHARMHQLEQDGDARAALVNRLRARKEQVIGALLVGNNAVNILASALATSVLINIFGGSGVAYATLMMTVVVVIFSVVLPKTYAINHADHAALRVAPLLEVLIKLLGPAAAGVRWLVARIIKLAGGDPHNIALTGSTEGLRVAIELHSGEGAEAPEEAKRERAMLRSILELNDVAVSEIMTHRRNLATVDAGLPTARVLDEALASPYTRLPLWKDDPDNIIGVIHAKALAREAGAHTHADQIDVAALAAKPWFIPDSTTLLDQLQAFRERREHFALVVDEYGVLMGVVTLEDILEEIVGDITDELDVQVAGVRRQPSGACIVDGWVTIRDLNREFEWRLPDDKASTIAGLVLHEARMIPEVGQSFTFYGFRFDILRRKRHQITAIRVTPPTALGEEAGQG